VIRPARAEDAEELAALQVAAWRAAYGEYVPADRIDAAAENRVDRWHEALAGEHGTFVIAGADAALIGFVSVGATRDEDVPPDQGELYAIYVEPHLIGTGIGTELLLYGEAELARACSGAMLWTFAQNTRARYFYERHGWTVDRTDPERYDWAPSVRYRKDLP
jgi:ribosomal protein S18 acetylase RimI-like enzyme